MPRPPLSRLPDLTETLNRLRSGATDARTEMGQSLSRRASPEGREAFIQTVPDADCLQQAEQAAATGPLHGLAVSVKDLFDVQGQVTAACSTVLADAPPAPADCPAVARLKAAGGVVVGRTHMVEFAFSGVGTNPHAPTPAAWDARFNRPASLNGEARVPGGSSSGAAVSVATAAAFIGLGSDTGGSIRIPAALNGLVGFKNTARLTPTAGTVPLSPTLDTACAITRSVRDAVLAHEILSGQRVERVAKPLNHCRFAIPRTWMLDALEPAVAVAFERSLAALRDAGAQVVEIDLREIAELADINASGGFAAYEAYAWHRDLFAARRDGYDPRVAARIERGAVMTPDDYATLKRERAEWIARMNAALAGFDAAISPTVPIVAPRIDAVAPATGEDPAADRARDAEFFRVNALLLRNTSVVNLLDGCAISLPCHQESELPMGLMLWHGALHDNAVLNLASQIEPLV